MILSRLALTGLVVTLGLGACQPSADDRTFDARVKAYLLSHPAELRAALDNMQAKEDEAAQKAQDAAYAKAKLELPQLRSALERDPRDFVVNPDGQVTVTEFYDFRCGHCANIAPKLVALVRERPDVRLVFKDLVIFGPTSEHAALVAIATKQQGKDVLALYQDYMSTHPLTDQAIDALARRRGVRLEAMQDPGFRKAAREQLDDNLQLASRLAIDGTPGFVIGDTLIEGEDYDGILAAIVKAEKKA